MLKLALPSKGRLLENTLLWLERRGIHVKRNEMTREYAGEIAGIEGLVPVFLPPSQIPQELAAARVDFGVTGQDMVREKLFNWSEKVIEIKPLGFGKANLVIAVPAFWADVNALSDLDAVCAQFRENHGRRLRIATKFNRLAWQFLKNAGVADYKIVESQGATEGAIKNEAAEAIIDITSTGNTLRDNHLKTLEDGLLLESQATLFQSRRFAYPPEIIADFLSRISD